MKTSVTLASGCTLVFLLFTFVAQWFINRSVSLCKRKQQTEMSVSSHPCAFVTLEAGICRCRQEEGKKSVAYEDSGAEDEDSLWTVCKHPNTPWLCCFIPLLIWYLATSSILVLVTV